MSDLNRLNKDELIYLISVIERNVRKEYEKYTVAPDDSYKKVRNIFKNKGNDTNKIMYYEAANKFIVFNYDMCCLNPVTLKLETNPYAEDDYFSNYLKDMYIHFAKDKLDTILAKNIQKVIAINRTTDESIKNESLSDKIAMPLQMFPDGGEVKLRDMLEIVFRLRRDKDNYEELENFVYFNSHIENGILYIEAKFVYYDKDGEEIETDDEKIFIDI